MSVASSTAAIQQIVATYRQQRDAILGNQMLSQDGKKASLARLEAEMVERAEAAAQRLWGVIVEPTPPVEAGMSLRAESGMTVVLPMTSELSASGEAWVAIAAAEARLAQTREEAERAGIDPAWIAHYQSRIASLRAGARGAAEFAKAYENAPKELQYAIQNYAPESFPSGLEWDRLRRRLEDDRAERVHTAAVQAAERAGSDIVDLLVNQAVPASKSLADELGRSSRYLGQLMGGIQVERVPMLNGGGWTITIARRSF